MTEAEAVAWLGTTLDVPRGTIERLAAFVALLRDEAQHQNLIAASTSGSIWQRHIVDSAQLLLFAKQPGTWLDLGSGAGFPGLIVAACGRRTVTLVESRRKRADFLREAAKTLDVADRTTIVLGRAESIPATTFGTISARAFAPLDRLLDTASRFAAPTTRWLLPKGRSAQAELDAARQTWQGTFRIEPSVTDPSSSIIVAEQVRRREQR